MEVQKAVDQSVEQLLEYHPPTLTPIPPHLGGRATQDDRGLRPPVGTRVPAISVGGYQGVNSLEESTRTQIGIHAGSSTQGGVNAQPKREPPTTNVLPLHCRVCKAPPTVTTQPTATTCGHLFCSEYVPRILGSVTRSLTPRQVHNTARGIHVQMPRVQQFPPVVLSVQTRSVDDILGLSLCNNMMYHACVASWIAIHSVARPYVNAPKRKM